jgi:hypothetical protein
LVPPRIIYRRTRHYKELVGAETIYDDNPIIAIDLLGINSRIGAFLYQFTIAISVMSYAGNKWEATQFLGWFLV